jgi:hypothetical protein
MDAENKIGLCASDEDSGKDGADVMSVPYCYCYHTSNEFMFMSYNGLRWEFVTATLWGTSIACPIAFMVYPTAPYGTECDT